MANPPLKCAFLAFFSLTGCLGVILGCAAAGKAKAEPDPFPAVQALEIGEKYVFHFEPDGEWHPSALLVDRNQRLTMRTVGKEVDLPIGAIAFKLNRQMQLMRPDYPFDVTKPGRLYFRLNQRFATADRSPVEIEIARIE